MSVSSFDVIIVGAGTAGCVLANRLSSSSNSPPLRILLLEAGPNNNDDPNVQIPLTSRRMFNNDKYDWCYETVPQEGLGGRVIQQTRGKMVGGSSAINSHSLLFPNKKMHDTWAELADDDRWSWEAMKGEYERFGRTSEDFGNSEQREGIKTSYPKQPNALHQAWENVWEGLGAKLSNGSTEGIGGFTTTNAIDGRRGQGERSHAGTAFLEPVSKRKNLTTEVDALVTRIVLEEADAETWRATGVEYVKCGQLQHAWAEREVIVCAGAFGSPQILELSGIGQNEVLAKARIDCLIDLPGVGENLQDHLNFGPSIEVEADIETMDAMMRDPEVAEIHRKRYQEHHDGPLAEGAAYSFAYWSLQLFNTASDRVDLEDLLEKHKPAHPNALDSFVRDMILSPTEASATVFMTRMQRYTTPDTRLPGSYMTVVAMLSHPFSRGSTHIQSSDPSVHPRIDPAYFSHQLDAEILSRHVLQVDRLIKQPTYANIIKPDGRRIPDLSLTTIEEVKKAIEKYGATNYHPCGTCAMMKRDLGGVVDGALRVYGTTNLRVCDASVFPIIPRANILTSVYAVAEKAATMILVDLRE